MVPALPLKLIASGAVLFEATPQVGEFTLKFPLRRTESVKAKIHGGFGNTSTWAIAWALMSIVLNPNNDAKYAGCR
jgi:hypothetical protein